MAAITPGTISTMPPGYNDENSEVFIVPIGDGSTNDTIDIVLPSDWAAFCLQGAASVAWAKVNQWTTAAAGARTITNVAVVITSLTEATATVRFTVGANVTGNASTPLGGAELVFAMVVRAGF